ncbi:helix-turn-helix domain-containing protein [Gemmata sp.]|uniref:helix-turn-helix domain-containing protein n=1 Tax=Gemmata sp. TaxID=1914242 RepID=UPI003F72B512
MLPQLNRFAPTAPTDAEVAVAKESTRRLSERAHAKGLRLVTDGSGGDIPLPPVAARLVRELLAALAEGQAVVVLPLHAELTTQEAADLLGVSRPHLVGLLDAGRLPHRKVGRHRRVRAGDVLAYQRAEHAARQRTLDQLAADAQELDMGY